MNKKLRQEPILVLVSLFFLFFFINVVSAIDMPILPTIIKGTISINNNPAPIGTTIIATINKTTLGETNITKEGTYVIAVGGDIKNTGKNINLYVDGIKTETNITWSSGSMNTQDIAVKTKNNNYLYAIIAAITTLIVFFALKPKKKPKK